MPTSHAPIRWLAPLDEVNSSRPEHLRPTRGVSWVLRWAAAFGTLVTSAAVLIEFGYCIAAEQTLARAARAGALEATLPRADYQSIEQTVRRRLDERGWPPGALRIHIEQNGIPVHGKFLARGGDQFSLSLAMPTAAVLPRWLRSLTLRPAGAELHAHAERKTPSARLR